MRLNELHIDGFGHFHQHTIAPLHRDVTVLYGPNEAGKSTLLAFIRTILFGFPSRRRNQYYPPLAGGRHGGRIRMTDDEGASYTLERFAGVRGGPYTLRAESGEPIADSAVLQQLTGHATLDLFSNVFAFSLDEIQNEDLMSNSDVAGRLYSVGMGASRIPELTKSLADRKAGLFRPRGSAQKIAVLIRDLDDIDGQLRVVQGNADEYRRLTDRQDSIRRELEGADSELSGLNTRRAEIDRLLQGWDDWVALEGFEAQLRDVPHFQRFPDNPIERMENLEDRVRQAAEDRYEAAEELRLTTESATASIPGENLLDDAKGIEAIRRARSSFDDSVHDLPERQDELKKMEDILSERLRVLGDGWDEASLDSLDTSLEVHHQIERWRDRLDEAVGNVDAAHIRLEQNRERLKGASI